VEGSVISLMDLLPPMVGAGGGLGERVRVEG
jgi:hypothetical protein